MATLIAAGTLLVHPAPLQHHISACIVWSRERFDMIETRFRLKGHVVGLDMPMTAARQPSIRWSTYSAAPGSSKCRQSAAPTPYRAGSRITKPDPQRHTYSASFSNTHPEHTSASFRAITTDSLFAPRAIAKSCSGSLRSHCSTRGSTPTPRSAAVRRPWSRISTRLPSNPDGGRSPPHWG